MQKIDYETDTLCCTANCMRLTLQISTLVVILTLFALILVSVTRTSKADVEIRRSIEATASRVEGGPGEPGASLVGKWVENFADMQITYSLRYPLSMSAIQSIVVRGPIVIGSNVGPVFFNVCGTLDTTVCDTTTLPGHVSATLHDIGTEAVYPKMKLIRTDPDLYYLELRTAAVPNEPGAARSPLYISMGPSL